LIRGKTVRNAAPLFRLKAQAILKRTDLDKVILFRRRHDELTLTHAGCYRRISLIAGHTDDVPSRSKHISAHRRPRFKEPRPLHLDKGRFNADCE
jgi:hypothetical protein